MSRAIGAYWGQVPVGTGRVLSLVGWCKGTPRRLVPQGLRGRGGLSQKPSKSGLAGCSIGLVLPPNSGRTNQQIRSKIQRSSYTTIYPDLSRWVQIRCCMSCFLPLHLSGVLLRVPFFQFSLNRNQQGDQFWAAPLLIHTRIQTGSKGPPT